MVGGIVDSIVREHGLQQYQVATIWGVTERTAREKLKSEEDISIDEVRALFNRCGGLSVSDCYRICSGEDLTMKQLMELKL